MLVGDAYRSVSSAAGYDYGKFYGQGLTAPLGVGQLYSNIRIPVLNENDWCYDTYESMVYVLTHECDVAQGNNRPFNKYALVCPILPLVDCMQHLVDLTDEGRLNSFFFDLGRDRISRLVYMPPIPDYLPFGGVLYLNQMTHTHVKCFEFAQVERVTTVTSYGLRIIDYKVTNHLLRPKSASLPLMNY